LTSWPTYGLAVSRNSALINILIVRRVRDVVKLIILGQADKVCLSHPHRPQTNDSDAKASKC